MPRAMARGALAAGVLAVFAAGCAHAPASAEAAEPARRPVTGTRIPRAVDPRLGIPVTPSPVKVYTREDLLATGRPDVGAALQQLDPGATPGP